MIEHQPASAGREGTDAPDAALDKASGEKAANKRLEEMAKGGADLETLHIRWINMSLTLASTGVAGLSALQYLEGSGRLDPYGVLRMVAATLVILGIGVAGIACVGHWSDLRRIERGDPPRPRRFPLSLVVGVVVAVLSVVALLAALTIHGDGGLPAKSGGTDLNSNEIPRPLGL